MCLFYQQCPANSVRELYLLSIPGELSKDKSLFPSVETINYSLSELAEESRRAFVKPSIFSLLMWNVHNFKN